MWPEKAVTSPHPHGGGVGPGLPLLSQRACETSGLEGGYPAGLPAAPVSLILLILPPHSSAWDLSKTQVRSYQSCLNPFQAPHGTGQVQSPLLFHG